MNDAERALLEEVVFAARMLCIDSCSIALGWEKVPAGRVALLDRRIKDLDRIREIAGGRRGPTRYGSEDEAPTIAGVAEGAPTRDPAA